MIPGVEKTTLQTEQLGTEYRLQKAELMYHASANKEANFVNDLRCMTPSSSTLSKHVLFTMLTVSEDQPSSQSTTAGEIMHFPNHPSILQPSYSYLAVFFLFFFPPSTVKEALLLSLAAIKHIMSESACGNKRRD